MTQPQPIGRCIYCLRADVELTDEHIVPYGLGNTLGDILYKASCKACAKITSRFETTMLRENLLPLRSVLQMPSRKSKKLHQTVRQRVKYTDGRTAEIDVPFDKYLGQFGLPIFDSPSYFQGDFAKQLLTVHEIQTFVIGYHGNKKWYEDQNIDEQYIHFIKSNKDQAYARLLIKIAYCAAVKFEGLEAVKDSPVRKLILGEDNHFAVYFGNAGDTSQFTGEPGNDTIIRYAVASIKNSSKKLAAVQLFPFMEDSPAYHTII